MQHLLYMEYSDASLVCGSYGTIKTISNLKYFIYKHILFNFVLAFLLERRGRKWMKLQAAPKFMTLCCEPKVVRWFMRLSTQENE